MEKIDTSTEAVTKLLDGVTPGPWIVPGQPDKICAEGYTRNGFAKTIATATMPSWMGYSEPSANARFIAASRDLVPALLAERDALRRENENLRQIERNVQAVREHEYKRAEDALAEVERLKAQPVTVQDAAKVPEVKALIIAAMVAYDSYWNSTDGVIRGMYDIGEALRAIAESNA